MISAIRHRGPDGFGFHETAQAGLAHARLSIIDLSTGDQPIRNEDGTVWVVFNGEIFNYIELRRDLESRGHRFYTQSDTEVIVHLYEEHGLEFVKALNGQFAIALWDAPRRRFVLARDRVGIRPVFYSVVDGRLLFGSEIKALLASQLLRASLNPDVLGQIFTYWAPLPGHCVFNDVHTLPPGHLLIAENGALRTQRYWDWDFDPQQVDGNRSTDSYRQELRTLLIDAVRLQLRADVPVGAYLSGGLDSSIITAIIKTLTDTPLRTFSLSFADAEFDEREFQQLMVQHLGTDHSEMVCTQASIAADFPRMIWHIESPVVRTAPTPLMALSQSVRKHGFKVVLTGEGADEVFAGYDLFREARVRRFIARNPASKWRPRLLDRLYPYLRNAPGGSTALARQFFAQGFEHLDRPVFAHLPRWQTTRRIFRFMHPDLQTRLATWDSLSAMEATLPAAITGWKPLGRDQYVEAQSLMSGYLLCSQGDRVAMANSIEGRFPYLDHRVIEFACALPPRLRLSGLNEKYLLREAFKDSLPQVVAKRVKQPYRAPDGVSFFVDGKPVPWVAETLSRESIERAGYFDARAVALLMRKCAAGRAIGFSDNMAFIGILSTQTLHDQFVRGTDYRRYTH